MYNYLKSHYSKISVNFGNYVFSGQTSNAYHLAANGTSVTSRLSAMDNFNRSFNASNFQSITFS